MMRLFLAILLFTISHHAWSQHELHVAKYYGVRDGLNNSVISCLLQDSRGFLWLGTKEGLNRFDGVQFKGYFSESQNPNSLSHNKVFDILEYQPGYLLFATGSGLSVLNTKTGKFENEKIKFLPLQARSGTIVSSMDQDKEGRIWINHSGEIDVFDKNLNYLYRFTDLEWAKSLKGTMSRYEDWYRDKKGRLWFPTDASGLQIIDFDAQKIYSSKNNPEHLPYLEYLSIRSFLLDETNNLLWLGGWGAGLIRFDLTTGKTYQEYFNIPEYGEAITINALLQTSRGTILFTIYGTCYEMDPVTMTYKQIQMSDGRQDYFIHYQPSFINGAAIIRGGDHQYWIAGTGLFQLNDLRAQKELIVVPEGNSSACPDLIIAESGIIYSLHDHGLLAAVDPGRQNVKHFHVPFPSNSLLTKLCEDTSGLLWIGSTVGIRLFDPETALFNRPPFLPADLVDAYINELFRDRDGDIWIGTREPFHLYCYKSSTHLISQIPDETVSQFTKADTRGRISTITEDSHGRLWMSSMLRGGILSYDKKENQWTSYPSEKSHYSFLVDEGIVSMFPDEDENLWVSTVFGDGLVCYHYQTDSITKYTRENGLLSDYVQAITADHAGNLWLTSEFGITKFTMDETHSVSNILFESDRYAFESFEASFDSNAQQLVLGIHDRHMYISTKKDVHTTPSPIPLVDKILVNNKEQFIDLTHAVLDLDHTEKNITIEFTAVHYTNADKLQFAYQLVGADDEWKYATLNRSAQYAALSPGSYMFKLKVADESGKWGPDHEMLSFTIVPPFWKTAWFILFLTSAIVLIAFLMVRKRIRVIRHESGLKQKIAETEMMALRAQMNPHFIFNCINSIDSLIQDNDKYQATVYLNKFAKLIRSILDSSKQNTVTLANDMETLKLYIEMEQFRNENKFTAEVKADPVLLQDDYKVPPLIIQPYVENAILHGLRNRTDNEGRLSVSLSRMNGHIQYIIEDNGVGRMQMQNGHSTNKVSYGMQMSSDRVRLFNQEENASIEIIDLFDKGNPAGTRVKVKLKMI